MAFRITCASLGICVGLGVGMLGMGGAGEAGQPGSVGNKADAKPAAAHAATGVDSPKNKNADGTLKVVVHHHPHADMGPGHRPPAYLIRVPDNTLGPGVPLWVQRDHAAASVRQAEAEADLARAAADHARPHQGLIYGDDDGHWHAPFSTLGRFQGAPGIGHGPMLPPGPPAAPEAAKERKP